MSSVAVFVSGGGSNMLSLIENNINISLVIADRECLALTRAKDHNIKTYNVGRVNTSEKILEILKDEKIDLIVLAGFLSIISKELTDKYKIINIHPSLLPKYGGVGMYGMNVHKAVFKNSEKVSGATVHYVNELVDKGDIIKQVSIDITNCKDEFEIAKKVLEIEHKLLPEVVKSIINKGV
ncbi:phosphoribosylglycinamide formyltransferase [Oceanivirga miroungae]|uniref:Phosphoribosylglycinamide formyltransferase n=1 Tax=Oceanivirga miroungae TaxID=1130046 RepID=A0A6I8M7X9_9FUSO|nr:phosphoribosylglycinamide formyltransferase [Oceanivirga miroungae]VWL85519.1 GDP-mannose 4,6-dehydratase / GDP-4-amino-4,6-dideoxy-D-mannose formyltransferase [Oceanivirga miroungae]